MEPTRKQRFASTSPEIYALRQDIEQELNHRMKTPADFDFLAGVVWEKLHENISPTTLKRMWGYVSGVYATRPSTLCLLARFLGYSDWEQYLHHLSALSDIESNMFNANGINVNDLRKGEIVEVTWLPNRRCVFRFMGDNSFIVVESTNSKLAVGDTFSAACFLVGQPMFLDCLVRQGGEPTSYVAGSKSGLISAKIL